MSEFRTRGFIPWTKIENSPLAFRSLRLRMTLPDARSHAAPVWYLRDGRQICIESRGDGVRKYHGRNPRIDWYFPRT